MLDQLIPMPRLLEIDGIDLAAPPARVWQLLRHENLASSPLVQALFALRELPRALRGKHAAHVDDARQYADFARTLLGSLRRQRRALSPAQRAFDNIAESKGS